MKKIDQKFFISTLPFSLVVLFFVQNELFNIWTNLTPNPFFGYFVWSTLSLGVLLYFPAFLFNKYWKYVYLVLVSLIVSLVFISQELYFSFFHGFLQASALKYAGQAGAEQSTVFTLVSPKIIIFLVNIATVITAFFISQKTKEYGPTLSLKKKFLTLLFTIIVGLSGYGLLLLGSENALQKIQNPYQTLQEMNKFTYSQNSAIQKVGVVNYYFADIIKMLFRDTNITKEETAFVQTWSAKKTSAPKNLYEGIAEGRNLIIIQTESLEDAVIGQKINGQEITPNLNRLTREGLYFNNYYALVGPGNTADAEFVTMNSLYPITNTVAFIDFPHNTYNALPKTLIQRGYSTYALHGDVATFWNRSNIYPSLGYETSISEDGFLKEEQGFELLSDNDFFKQSAEKIKTFEQPFMATLITLSSHTPFAIPKEYQRLSLPENSTLTEQQKNYLISIHYTDQAIGNFIAELKKNGLYNSSVIAIYGDHGSSTNISSVFHKESGKIPDLNQNHVPLIVLAPGAILPRVINTPASHIDFYPTMTNLLGISAPREIVGKDILGTKNPVVTRRDPYTQFITTILTKDLVYAGSEDGIFENGRCMTLPTRKKVPNSECQEFYNSQIDTTRASDLIVRGNLIPLLSSL